ncbi:D-alanyl-D-alanine carboxypeptidase family protein [Treponema sp. R6D11]
MKFIEKQLLVLFLLLSFVAPVNANSAKSSILIEKQTGRVLLENNANERMGMASTTKIMTAIVALENSKLTDVVTASHNASMIEGTSIYLAEGEQMLMEDLLYALLLNSGNDVATAIAEHLGKNEAGFVKLMNAKAIQLGLKNTHFTNPHGLADPQHYTTSYELAMIARYALNNPKFAEIVSTQRRRIARQREGGIEFLKNHNKLLGTYEGATGIKTGFTKKQVEHWFPRLLEMVWS